MGVSISDQELVKALDSMKNFDRRVVFRMIGADMKISTMNNFREQRDPVTGRPWQPIRPITKNSRPKKTETILQDSTRLLRSINSAKPEVTNNSVQIGTNLPYARAHQQGILIRAKKAKYLTIPASPEAKRAKTFQRFWEQCVRKGQRPYITGKKGDSTRVMMFHKGAYAARSDIRTRNRKTKAGKTRKARMGTPTVGFILKKAVVLPRRRFMGFSFKDKNMVIQRFKQGVIMAENRAVGNTPPPGKEYW